MDFVHLHAHSSYSLLQGAMTPQELVAAAEGMGLPAVAVTDTNGLYGAVVFYQAARAAGVRPIIGAEIVYGNEQAVLLAADRQGYANICRIITERRLFGTKHEGSSWFPVHSSWSWQGETATDVKGVPGSTFKVQRCGEGERSAAVVDVQFRNPHSAFRNAFSIASSVSRDPRGLFVLTASPALLGQLVGVVPAGRLYAELRVDDAHSFETRCPAICGVRGAPRGPSTVIIADLAERLGVPLVATVNAHFLTPEDRPTHAVLSAIRENVPVKALAGQASSGATMAGPRSYYMSPEEVAARLPASVRREAMANTRRIAEECELELESSVPHFPRADLAPGEDACRKLRAVAYEGAHRRYGARLSRAVRERLDRELAVIAQLDFCDYFLVVRDIVEFAEREGIPHVGRGSAANSIVSYCLGISAVCPLKFDLYFERFLNEFRTDVPDIDIDFCWRRRDDVIHYVYERYGAGRVAMVATHSTLRARSAFRDVGRVMGLPLDEVGALSKLLPHYGASSIEEAMGMFPEMAGFPIDREPWRTVVRTALKIDGYVRHLSIHLGGLVIGDRPLTWYTPLEDSAKGIVVTQYEMKGIEATGLVKIDLLGQRSLSIVSEAARSVEEGRGIRVDLDQLPDADPPTAALLRRGRTMGCFQVESPGMRALLQMQQAQDITDLIQGLSLIRPGPSSSGMKHAFIRRRRGEEPVPWPTPLLKKALGRTYGVMLYQEDILRVAQVVAGFSLAEGDELRKLISKKRSREKLRELRGKFVSGAVERGVEAQVAGEIWDRIEDFAAYSYCKAHATTYGHISYQAAYLKAHWPAEFLASVIANKAGFYDARTYFEEARRLGVEILAPDVNESEIETKAEAVEGVQGSKFKVQSYVKDSRSESAVNACVAQAPSPAGGPAASEASVAQALPPAAFDALRLRSGQAIRNSEAVDSQFRTPNSEFRISPGSLRPGLEFVKSLAATTIRQILEQRLHAPFVSLEDFHARVRLSREELENLILCGAFDSLGETRPTLMMKMERLLKRPRQAGTSSPTSGLRRQDASGTPPGRRRYVATSTKACHSEALLPGAEESLWNDRRRPHDRVVSASLFEYEPAYAAPVAVPPQPPYPLAQRVLWELRILGFSHSGHPLDAWNGQLGRLRGTPSHEIARHVGQRVTFIGWLVTLRRAVTKRHDYMEFLTLEDRHGIVEAVLFPDVYRRYGAQVTDAGCYKVVGRVDEEHGAVNLVAESVEAVGLA